MIYTAQITDIDKVLDGSPVFTAVNAAGATMYPCYLMSAGGGYAAVHNTPPLRVGSVVVLARPDGNEPFYIMGALPAPADQAAVTLAGVTAETAVDYTGHALDETVLTNTNSTLILSPRNNAVLNAPSIKLQLQGGGLRVSQQGTAANGVLNADPFINTLFTYLAEIVARIQVIERATVALYNTQRADLAVEVTEIGVRVSAGTATPVDLARLAEINQLQGDIQLINTQSVTASNVVQSRAEDSINDHIRIP